jgi:hypothetical protein
VGNSWGNQDRSMRDHALIPFPLNLLTLCPRTGVFTSSEAKVESLHTCEVCGQPGTRRYGSWIRTLCDEHARDR